MSSDAPIEVVPYAPGWPVRFAEEAALIRVSLSRWLVAEPEHIGSTAVPGLAAKPVIDIMAPVASLQDSLAAVEAAQGLGYCYFPYKPEQMHWFCKPSPSHRTHHLHLVPYNSSIWLERLAFREALRANPTLAAQYAALKRQLAVRHRADREAYTEGKSAFVAAVLQQWQAGGHPGFAAISVATTRRAIGRTRFTRSRRSPRTCGDTWRSETSCAHIRRSPDDTAS